MSNVRERSNVDITSISITPYIFTFIFVSHSFISSRFNSIAFEYAKLLPRWPFLAFRIHEIIHISPEYVCVCVCGCACADACLRQAWLSCSRLPARDTCGRWSSAHTYTCTRACTCARTRARVWMRQHVDHTITQRQNFAERIEFVEITFSRAPALAQRKLLSPTGIREARNG